MMVMCVVTPATMIEADFMCMSNDNTSTMTHYNHLEEARLEDGPIGYDTRSLSYLVDGAINFNDYTVYEDTQGPNCDPLLYRDQTVEFHGEKSISEFSAEGLYPSNRILRSQKKIHYIDLTASRHNELRGANMEKYSLGNEYSSKDIKVRAKAGMGSNSPLGDYGFEYMANITNGTIIFHDRTGWTNRSGDGMIDWEQEGEIKGNITVVNNLRGVDLFRSCNLNWLPCI